MNRRFLHKTFAICLLFSVQLLFGLPVLSQSSNFRFRFLNLPEDFSSQYITLLDEDAAGMLWFVTNNGLHRYDGNEVLTFDLQSNPSLPDLNINCLFADSHANLWMATPKGLVRFDLKKWTTALVSLSADKSHKPESPYVTAIAEGKNGTVFLGSATGELFSYSQDGSQLVREAGAENGNSISFPIKNIQEVSAGWLWFTNAGGQLIGLSRRSGAKKVYRLKAFEKTGIDFFAFDRAGRCFVYANETGPFLFDTASNLLRPLALPATEGFSTKGAGYPVLIDDDRVAFFFRSPESTRNSFSVYDLKNGSFRTLDNLYPATFKTSIFRKVQSKKESVYISTDRGVGVITNENNPFGVALADLQNINSIRTIYKQQNNRFYISSYKDKFTLYSAATNENFPLSSLMVSSILPWSKDSLLMGTEGNFPMWYIPALNRFSPALSQETVIANPVLSRHIVCLCKENDTAVWAGTYWGCYLFNPLTGNLLKKDWQGGGKPLQKLHVDDIIKIGQNRFFASNAGVFKYSPSPGLTTKLFEGVDSILANGQFLCLRFINNCIWAGTNGNGIVVFDTAGNIQRRITAKDGLASNIVFSLPAQGNYVMAGTSKGLSVIEGASGGITNYSSQRYLPSNEFNRNAWLVDGDTLFMGTTNGFIRFTPAVLHRQTAPLSIPVRLTSISLNSGRETIRDYTVAYTPSPSVSIPAGTRSFSLSFGTLDEAAAEMALYYRFADDSTWQKIGARREITFVALPPGGYSLQLAGQLPDGQRTSILLTLPLYIQPLFYQTLWFKGVLLLAGGLLVVWVIKRRERGLRKEQRLRSRIAGDLHDEVGSALTRIYFQASKLAEAGNPAVHTPHQAPLERIVTSSQEALSSMNDMVWSIDAHYDNASDMVGRMKDYVARLQDEFDCRLSFEISGGYKKRYVSQLTRQNVFLIFKEALTNALKYGRGKEVDIQLLFDKTGLTLTVQNEKAALPAAARPAQGGQGLKNMQLRADKIKATLSVTDKGPLFTVRLCVEA